MSNITDWANAFGLIRSIESGIKKIWTQLKSSNSLNAKIGTEENK